MVDFEDIKKRVTIEDILTDCGYHPKRNRMSCPIHNGSNPTSFSFADHVYYCHSCGASGGLLDLTEALFDVDRQQALKYLAEKAGTGFRDDHSYRKQKLNPSIKTETVRIHDAELINLQGNLEALDVLQNHFTRRITNARKHLNNRTINLARYYAITQYAEYVLDELDTEIIRTNYEINVEKKRIRNASKLHNGASDFRKA